ncbi:hypothetical protein F5Y04DRAFT_251030 [Hypomontagnella monticulosa]|nr:hypothetical protein F5Y04DRAFT_251030 [Hypomontagnella monticulosa]
MAPPQAPTGWYATGLEDILPRRGFTYPAGHKVFTRERDSILIKWALQSKEAHRSETGVDHALGAIMNDAIAIADGVWKDERQRLMDGANSPLRVPLAAIFESARKFYSWTEMVGDDLFPYLMLDLIRARRTYRLLFKSSLPPSDIL